MTHISQCSPISHIIRTSVYATQTRATAATTAGCSLSTRAQRHCEFVEIRFCITSVTRVWARDEWMTSSWKKTQWAHIGWGRETRKKGRRRKGIIPHNSFTSYLLCTEGVSVFYAKTCLDSSHPLSSISPPHFPSPSLQGLLSCSGRKTPIITSSFI